MYKNTFIDNEFHYHYVNGLKVVTLHMPSFYTVSAGLFIKVGGRYEELHQMGISHFIEHLLFKGSDKYSCREISEIIEGCGGQINAYTLEEYTCFHFKTFPQHFYESMDVLLDMITKPAFSEEDFKKEREIILEEIRACEDQPNEYIHDVFASLIWPDHPLGNIIVGTEDTLSTLSFNDVWGFFYKTLCIAKYCISCSRSVFIIMSYNNGYYLTTIDLELVKVTGM